MTLNNRVVDWGIDWKADSKRDILKKFDRLVANGTNLDIPDVNGNTPLMQAIYWERDEIIDWLIAKKVNLDARNGNGNTALMQATFNADLGTIEKLVLAKAKLDLQNDEGLTALMYSANWGHGQAAEALINAGAKLDLQDDDGNTALMKAVFGEYVEIVKKLIDAGADLNLKNKNMQTAYDIAVEEQKYNPTSKTKMIVQMLKNAQKRKENNEKWAEGFGNIDWEKDTDTEILAKIKGSDVNIEFPDGRKNTPLLFAISFGKLKTAKFLIANKANVNHKNSMGFTPLMTAALKGHTEIVKKLLDAGAKVDIARQGRTALNMIKGKGKTEIEQLLIQAQKKQKTNFALLNKVGRGGK